MDFLNTIAAVTLGVFFSGVLNASFSYFKKIVTKLNTKPVVTEVLQEHETQNVVNFDNIAGMDSIINDLREIVDMFLHPKKFEHFGASMPKSILILGPSRSGKSMIGYALANEADINLILLPAEKLEIIFKLEDPQKIHDIFDQIKRAKPCVLFIDDIHMIGTTEMAKTRNFYEFVSELDKLDKTDFMIIATADSAQELSSALLKKDRFNKTIKYGNPNIKSREQILNIHSKDKYLALDVDLKKIAYLTYGASSADLAQIINEAAILAIKNGTGQIYMNEILEAISKIPGITPENERKILAYHEAGHVIAAYHFNRLKDIKNVSIGSFLENQQKYKICAPNEDDAYVSKRELWEDVIIALAGEACEKIILDKNDITNFSIKDFELAKRLVVKYVTKYCETNRLKVLNEDDPAVQDEANKILRECYEKTLEILSENKLKTTVLIENLLEREEIPIEELDELIS